MLGLLEDVEKRCAMGFLSDGDEVFLLGATLEAPAKTLSGSEYLREIHDLTVGRPEIDLDLEARVQRVCLEAIHRGLLRSAHYCSQGGLAVALAECCIAGGRGIDAAGVKRAGRLDAALFGEAQSRIVVSCAAEAVSELESMRDEARLSDSLRRVGGERLTLGGLVDVRREMAKPIEEPAALTSAWCRPPRRGLYTGREPLGVLGRPQNPQSREPSARHG
jgi:phosphoribosylformylglycinamidine synthase